MFLQKYLDLDIVHLTEADFFDILIKNDIISILDDIIIGNNDENNDSRVCLYSSFSLILLNSMYIIYYCMYFNNIYIYFFDSVLHVYYCHL